MSKRIQALKRIALVIPLILVTYLVGFLAYFIFVPWFIVDVLWQLITGREGLEPGGTGTRIAKWQANNSRYVVFGQGEWQWTP